MSGTRRANGGRQAPYVFSMFKTQAAHRTTLGAVNAQNNGAYRVLESKDALEFEPVGDTVFSAVAVGFL